MDRNTVIGFSLIFLILMGYYWYTAPTPQEQARIQKTQDSILQVAKTKDSLNQVAAIAEQAKQKSVSGDTITADHSSFSAFARGESKEITLTNGKVTVSVLTKGGSVGRVLLNGYQRADSTALELLNPSLNQQYWQWTDEKGNQISSNNYYWQVVEQTPNSVALKLAISDTSYLLQKYSLTDTNAYVVKYDFDIVGMNNYIRRGNSDFKMTWSAELQKQEKDLKWEDQNTHIVYKMPGENPEIFKSADPSANQIKNRLQWVAFKQQYFSCVLANTSEFSTDAKISWAKPGNKANVKKLEAITFVEYKGESTKKVAMNYYFGPNHFNTLKESNIGIANAQLERIVPMGWGIFGWVNRYVVVKVFSALDGVIGSMGVIILLLTIIIKVILLPLVYKSYVSTAKMRILKPEIDEIKEKYGNDMQKMQTENMALYKKAGVSPLSGCVPMLLQMPILFAMFQFFPNAFELRQKSFLWSHDLSRYDSIFDLGFNIPFYGDHVSLFTLLMTVSTLIYTHLNNQISGVTGPMKNIGYIMPVIFLGVLNDYASGLTWYYFVSNMITFGQQWAIRRMVDDKKLHAQIAESRKKPVTKSGFQKRMEDAMRISQQRAAAKKKN